MDKYDPYSAQFDKHLQLMMKDQMDELEALISPQELMEIIKDAAYTQGNMDPKAPDYLPKTVEEMNSFAPDHWVIIAAVNVGLHVLNKAV
ncbi:hypothetical protein [Planctobacterium marinum]|uniref:hypothetical protein n=1 Tax=Planctobacterium marinum TaxID=1631968 RepID=UPI001E31CB94|nr:hypothetical protein [Planctobacterium marinum]MCC2604099.1 hypothetical protein [Planctobacterium marinum]